MPSGGPGGKGRGRSGSPSSCDSCEGNRERVDSEHHRPTKHRTLTCMNNPHISLWTSLKLCFVRRRRVHLSDSAALCRGLIGPPVDSHGVLDEANEQTEARPRTGQQAWTLDDECQASQDAGPDLPEADTGGHQVAGADQRAGVLPRGSNGAQRVAGRLENGRRADCRPPTASGIGYGTCDSS